jgi:hypothetical protein
MQTFLAAFGGLVLGVLHGFDRLIFRGHLRQLSYVHGMDCYLAANHVLLKDFKAHALQQTAALLDASLARAQAAGRPVLYLNSTTIAKDDTARQIACRDDVRDGLICVLKCVEPCWTFEVHRDRARRLLQLRGKPGKCLHVYHYLNHPLFGLMHVRVQTWFPFAVQVYVNGREWLCRQLEQAGVPYQRRDNKIVAVEDFTRAQALLDSQVRQPWPETLAALLALAHPAHPQLLGRLPVPYYWSVYQSEWASDVVFHDRASLERLFPPWVRHAITHYRSAAVLRFLGRAVPLTGQAHRRFAGEVVSTLHQRDEGLCVRHAVGGNSVKMYDCDRVLRIETTVNEPKGFKVFRSKETEPQGAKDWRVLRRSVADLPRRAEVSQACNERYAAQVAATQATTPLRELAEPLCRRVTEVSRRQGRRARALNPLAAGDAALLAAVSEPKFAVAGLRNRDLVALLYPQRARTEAERRRRAARVTRQIRLLRAHGILHKLPRSHRYQVSAYGRQAVTALLAARAASIEQLTASAA